MKEALLSLIKRDIKGMYAGSFFGLSWLFLSPLISTAIFYILFIHILKVKFEIKGYKDINYFTFLLSGLAFWNGFSSSLMRGISSPIENAFVIKKIPIPNYFIVISSTFSNFLITPVISFYVFALNIYHESFINLINLTIYWVLSYSFVLGVCLFISSFTVYIRDIPQIIGNILNLIFYSVPIIYPETNIPKTIESIIKLNPLFFYVRGFHEALIYNIFDIKNIFECFLISSLALILGLSVFKKLEKGFADVL